MRDRRRSHLSSTLLVLSTLMGGCIPKVTVRDAAVPLPEAYETTPAEEAELPDAHWDAFFDDPQLSALIAQALQNNQELGILGAEIDVTYAEVVARRGEFLPRADVGLEAGVEKVGRYTSQGAADEAVEITPGKHVPEHLPDFRVGFIASWEVDIWRRLHNSTQAARRRYLASIEGRRFEQTRVVAEVARGWYELMALDNQLEVVDGNIDLLEQGLNAARLQKQAARVTELGVQRFEAELLKNRSRRYELKQAIVETENHLNLVCGRLPQPIDRPSATFADLEPRVLSSGVPTALLENRPDVRAASAELEAAKLDVKAARALFYPSLSIDANLGLESFSLKHIALMPESLLYNAAANVLSPLLNRKAIKARYYTANADQMKAVYGYERAVLTAYVEVANQLSRIENLEQSFDRRQQQVEILDQAIETSNLLFRSARADYLEVLTTRREALESRLELIETKQRQLAAVVDLYQALGGGWQQPPTATN